MIVLDTHAFYAVAFEPSRLGRGARRAVARESSRRGLVISDVTLSELVTLDLNRKIRLEPPFGATLQGAIESMSAAVRPIDPAIAGRAHALGGTLSDPADRIIVATALELGCALVTSDGEITDASVVETIW